MKDINYKRHLFNSLLFIGYSSSIPNDITTIGLTSTATSLVVESDYSSALTVSSSTYIRPESFFAASGFYYQAIEMNVATTGMYTILSNSGIDMQGFIYNNSFNTSFPDQNLVSFDDDSGGSNKQFTITAVLQAMTMYILFVTTYKGNTLGEYSIIGFGPAAINFSAIIVNSSKILFKSNYSSALNTNSPVYIGSEADNTMSYYQAIKTSVLTTGIYTILCSSTMDTYGYMYNRTFNPAYPYQNMLLSDDETGENSQFLLTVVFQAMVQYILIVTTYEEKVTGRFSLIGQGPDSISFSP
ncbi:hypothetical protein I4U23_016347, partial [Adineta vaga]